MFALLGQMRANSHTFVLVEHEVSAATLADRVLLLAAGEIVAVGPPEHLLPQTTLLERYGVRPRDTDRVFQSLGIPAYPGYGGRGCVYPATAGPLVFPSED